MLRIIMILCLLCAFGCQEPRVTHREYTEGRCLDPDKGVVKRPRAKVSFEWGTKKASS
jgi:hypothetical protein